MERDSSLEGLAKRWHERNPNFNGMWFVHGCHRCLTPGCRVLIDDSRTREYCFFHGGQPNDHEPAGANPI